MQTVSIILIASIFLLLMLSCSLSAMYMMKSKTNTTGDPCPQNMVKKGNRCEMTNFPQITDTKIHPKDVYTLVPNKFNFPNHVNRVTVSTICHGNQLNKHIVIQT